MKIAQIAPIWNRIPPILYGGTERIVYYLTEELVRRGHQVTLFATADSQTTASLSAIVEKPLYDMGIPWENVSFPLYHISTAFDKAANFDIVHMHLGFASDFISFPICQREKTPTVFTVHFRFKNEAEGRKKGSYQVLNKYKHLNFVSISNSQRTMPLNFVATVYNGIPVEEFEFTDNPAGDYLLWIGRVSPEKGTKEAIEVAKRLGMPIILTGKIDLQDKRLQEYYQQEIAPLIDGEKVRFMKELSHLEKVGIYKNARAFLFPLNWQEPFGLVLTEAMACGTPVIAYARGSVPEVVVDGVTGFIVAPQRSSLSDLSNLGNLRIKTLGLAGLVEAVERINSLSQREYRQMRAACRRRVEENFTVEKMVTGYEEVYKKVLRIK